MTITRYHTGLLLISISGFLDNILGCPNNCASCSGNSDVCVQCDDGFWLSGKYCYHCPENCEKCTDGSTCSKCKANFWNIQNYQVCKWPCHEQCSETGCDDVTGYCYECKPGFYGSLCENSCHLCTNGDCELRQCTTGCIAGHYEQTVGGFKRCKKSFGNCTLCDSDTTCLQCAKGFYLRSNGPDNNEQYFCSQCPLNCEECSTFANCTICKSGKYGEVCSYDCNINKCQKCTKVESTVKCTECENGYKVENNICSPETAHCSEHCYNVCDRKGHCLDGCKDGWTGQKCTNECPDKCLKCDQNDSTVCTISTTPDTDLFTNTSSTLPNKVLSTTERTEEPGQQNSSITIIGSGAGGGLLVLIVIVVVILCLLKRSRTKDQTSHIGNEERETRQNKLNDIGDIYARPNKQRKEESQEYIYAQPNKQKKSIHHKKDEISAPQNMYDNFVINLDAEDNTREAETDMDEILLENIDDEPKSIIVTDVNIPASDTYYNMAGLVRSRVQISQLYDNIQNKSNFESEFEKLPKGLTRTCNEALKPHNRAKNRYNGIYAYDATRVVLRSESFINANYVEGHGQSQISYIASLGPTKRTMDIFATFWEMVWQEHTNKIVMLTNLDESKKMKCEQYWPDQGRHMTYGDFTVTCAAEKVFSDFVVRDFIVKQHSEARKVKQYHYTAWPDKSVPHTVASLVEFRDKVEQGERPIQGRMIVHCSAGIGRTGTYIALDILIREGKEEASVDIFGYVIGLRGQRVSLVQNVEQYIFLHHCVLYALTCEPDIFPGTAIPHAFTDEKIATQYQSFQNLKQLTVKDKRMMIQAKGSKKNRKGADIPDDDHRVRLTLTKHDCINAVYVNGYKEKNKFILAQTPLPNTVEDFLSMLYQEMCSYIVCLDEENINDKTVAQYIPPANKVSTFGHFKVSCTRSDSREDFIIRELKLSRVGSPPERELTVHHYQLKCWKSQDIVPKKTSSLLNTIVDVEKVRGSSHSEQPIVIHCLTGSERTGLFCVVSVLLEKMAIENELSLLNTICQVRSRRRSAIQDIEQLRFCYNCIEESLEMPDTNTYYNIGNV